MLWTLLPPRTATSHRPITRGAQGHLAAPEISPHEPRCSRRQHHDRSPLRKATSARALAPVTGGAPRSMGPVERGCGGSLGVLGVTAGARTLFVVCAPRCLPRRPVRLWPQSITASAPPRGERVARTGRFRTARTPRDHVRRPPQTSPSTQAYLPSSTPPRLPARHLLHPTPSRHRFVMQCVAQPCSYLYPRLPTGAHPCGAVPFRPR